MEELTDDIHEDEEAHVYEERCFICNEQCYSKPVSPSSAPHQAMTKWALETRQTVYEAFAIQVDPSFFQETQGELPICPLCSFTVGRLKVVQKQLQEFQSAYDKIKAEIALSIVDVVSSTGGSKNHLVNLGNKSSTSILNSFRQCEAECLQQLIFESWRDRKADKVEDVKDKPKAQLKDLKAGKLISNGKELPKLERLPSSKLQNGIDSGSSNISKTTKSNSEESKPNPTNTTAPVDDVADAKGEDSDADKPILIPKLTKAVPSVSDDEDDSNKATLEIEEVPEEEDESQNDEPKKQQGESVTITLSPQFCHEDGYSETEFINENSDEEMDFDDEFPNELEITEWSGSSNGSHELHGLDEEFAFDDADLAALGTVSGRKTCGIRDSLEMQQNEEGLYVCMFCSKTFIHKYPYRDHLKTHTGEGPRCEICHKIFPKNHNLMLHMRTHTGEKPYICEVCNKGFADKSNLKVHMRVHTGERPYKCEFCDQAFVNSSRLVVHRRLHTGEKPFNCEQCARSFSTGSQLQAHQKLHTSGKPFACDICAKPYSSATSLQSHKNLYHGI